MNKKGYKNAAEGECTAVLYGYHKIEHGYFAAWKSMDEDDASATQLLNEKTEKALCKALGVNSLAEALGMRAQIRIKHTQKGEKVYANVTSVAQASPSTVKPVEVYNGHTVAFLNAYHPQNGTMAAGWAEWVVEGRAPVRISTPAFRTSHETTVYAVYQLLEGARRHGISLLVCVANRALVQRHTELEELLRSTRSELHCVPWRFLMRHLNAVPKKASVAAPKRSLVQQEA